MEKINFSEIKALNLSHNKITDIKVLVKLDLNQLKKLKLNDNKIDTNKNKPLIEKLRLAGII